MNMITGMMDFTDGKLGLSIIDKRTPIIVPFAPRYLGKTCLLHRLIHYIRNNGYIVQLDKIALCQHFNHSIDVLDEYTKYLCSECSPCATTIPIFGRVFDWNGKTKVQFVDFPGDFLYNINHPNSPSVLKDIIASPNEKIWLFMLELDGLGGQIERTNYSERIMKVAAYVSPNDKVIAVVNKIDLCSQNLKSKKDIRQAICHQYPTVLNCFKNQNPVTKLWKPYNCDIIPFTAGSFWRTCDNKERFQPGLDTYPKQLWKAIFKNLR